MTLFTTVDPRPIHFMGIAGAGMSGLALLAKEQAVAITGCDNDPSGAADLAAVGVEIWRGHDAGHVAGARAVVVTAAVAGDHPELERARALGVPVIRRADALGQVVAGGALVAVAGTHGKATTTVVVTEARAGGAGRPGVRCGCADRRSAVRAGRLDGAHRAAEWAGGAAPVASARAPQPAERRGGARGGARARRRSGALRRRTGGVHRGGAALRASRRGRRCDRGGR